MEYVVWDQNGMEIMGFGNSMRDASLHALQGSFSSPRDFDCSADTFGQLLDELESTGADLCCAVSGWCVGTQSAYREAVCNQHLRDIA